MRSVAQSLWASVQGDPVFMRRLNGWLTIVWIVMIPVSMVIGWLHSVAFVSALSLWALVSGHWSASGTRRGHAATRSRGPRANPIEEKVVDEIVERTEIDQASAGIAG